MHLALFCWATFSDSLQNAQLLSPNLGRHAPGYKEKDGKQEKEAVTFLLHLLVPNQKKEDFLSVNIIVEQSKKILKKVEKSAKAKSASQSMVKPSKTQIANEERTRATIFAHQVNASRNDPNAYRYVAYEMKVYYCTLPS